MEGGNLVILNFSRVDFDKPNLILHLFAIDIVLVTLYWRFSKGKGTYLLQDLASSDAVYCNACKYFTSLANCIVWDRIVTGNLLLTQSMSNAVLLFVVDMHWMWMWRGRKMFLNIKDYYSWLMTQRIDQYMMFVLFRWRCVWDTILFINVAWFVAHANLIAKKLLSSFHCIFWY